MLRFHYDTSNVGAIVLTIHGTCLGEKSEPCVVHIYVTVGSDGIIAFIYQLCSFNFCISHFSQKQQTVKSRQ